MVEIMGIGVLIEGKSGLGKSETALGLIRKGAALVSDDMTAIRLDSSGSLIASPINVTRYHMEVRGVGIIHVPSLFGVASVREEKRLDLVISLRHADDTDVEYDATGETRLFKTILGVRIPDVVLKVTPGRNITNVVEAAALNEKLRRLGHDAAKELDEKLMALISRGRDGSE
jgi:HPr kinase/phosphorylase